MACAKPPTPECRAPVRAGLKQETASDSHRIQGNEFLDRLGGDERTAPLHRFRQTVELIFEFGLQPEGEN